MIRTHFKKEVFGLLLVLFVCQKSNAQTQQSIAYESATSAIKKGNVQQYNSHLSKVSSSELKNLAYGEYLIRSIDKASQGDILSYLDNNKGLYKNKTLRTLYLQKLFDNNNFQSFDRVFDGEFGAYQISDSRLKCVGINRLGKDFQPSEDLVNKLWLTTESQPNECDVTFSVWQTQGLLPNEKIWQRIDNAIDANKPKLVSYISKYYLDNEQNQYIQAWTNGRYATNAAQLTNSFTVISRSKNDQVSAKLITDIIDFHAKNSTTKTYQLWQQVKSSNKNLTTFEDTVMSAIASRAILKEDRDARQWLSRANKINNEVAAEVAIRGLIGEQKWQDVSNLIGRMPSESQQKVDWIYWKARAIEKLGDAKAAAKLYESIADMREYYSFLAADRIGKKYNYRNEPPKFDHSDKLAQTPYFKTVKQLLDHQLFGEARVQWIYATQNFNEIELSSAAKLAADWKFYDRAIITAGQAKIFDAVELRFPLAYLNEVQAAAKQYNLPAEFIYGIIRQESAFMDQVRSHAGALGLMQIMPATGEEIARKTGLRGFNTNDLLSPSKNIPMGTYYIYARLRDFKMQYPVAISSYNAGPGNARRWLPSKQLEADAWVETITYRETRKYVKRVLEYTIVYRHLLGQSEIPISEYLGQYISK